MNDDDEAQARNRYFVIQLMRILGVALVLVGILVVRGKIAIEPVAGYAFIAIGLADVFVMPLVLARKWRTPRE